ncbi:septum formation initiator family protein [Persephonella sp.]
MGKAVSIELKKDLYAVRKYFKYWLIIGGITFGLAVYNSLYFETEREITQLINKKSYLEAKNLQLKKEISRLSAPDRISKLARQKLKMREIDYSRVHFIDLK